MAMTISYVVGALLLLVLGSSASIQDNSTVPPQAKRKIFAEYLGAEGYSVTFAEVPIEAAVDFYFILSFAVDADEDGKPRNGIFSQVWSEDLTPESVREIKSSRSNVKVLMSLGGWSVYTRAGKDKILFWYDPKDPEAWIKNAHNSIAKIVRTYSLDGIDIDYESFHSENTTFAYCIGELITRLKADKIITIATIAPFENIDPQYIELFQSYNSTIDYVNYQFYTTRNAPSVDKFVANYNRKAEIFGVDKTLVSLQVRDRGIQGDDFFAGVHRIVNETSGRLPGIMMWSLDMSVHYKTKFLYETKGQEILLGF
ncbi:hypothetical protein SELMODRAFT_411181 [Selaginella moellendorffii]|uniref:GH18 domain-containing protein n=1 Tax=Selaginella moellendorffii TaxID=88036 RepID=D8RGU1_SELML|nr:chitinase 2 [Selaginella moellendorffii]EFJ28648.1 hypothetical protein SELMODRAFT_411181 [Selaginella moellendorffii]|eukprot:XP_002970518.1 chitinase 2 [Selaginella moellendorffii]